MPVERRHREIAVDSVLAIRAAKEIPPRHLMREWVSRDAPMRDLLEEFFQPVKTVAQAIATAEARGFEAGVAQERACVVDVLKRREEAERSAYEASYYGLSEVDLSKEHPGELRAEAFADVRQEIERAEHEAGGEGTT